MTVIDELEKAQEWMHEPENWGTLSTSVIAEWLNNRPMHLFAKAADNLEELTVENERLKEFERQHDYCCCGDRIDSHGLGSGHSPVSMYDYAYSRAIERAEAAEKERDEWRKKAGRLHDYANMRDTQITDLVAAEKLLETIKYLLIKDSLTDSEKVKSALSAAVSK